MSQLILSDIQKSFGRVHALDSIELTVAAGSRMAIVGPSASGKTTLLRIIAGFEAPDRGTVRLDGGLVADGRSSVPSHRRGIGFVAQDGALFPHLTVAGNVAFGLDITGAERIARLESLLAMVDLDASILSRRPDELSGGQQQRVAIARALAQRPRLMLLDEPFSSLDTNLRATTRRAVADVLMKAGITTILVTHDQTEALSFADQVAIMQDGRLAQTGTPRDLYLRPKTQAVAAYLGEAIIVTGVIADGWAATELGRIAIHREQPIKRASILVRPEQISLDVVAAIATVTFDEGVGYAQITNVEYGGASCSLTLRLLTPIPAAAGARGADETIVIRLSGFELPPLGALVRITIKGMGHVLEGATT